MAFVGKLTAFTLIKAGSMVLTSRCTSTHTYLVYIVHFIEDFNYGCCYYNTTIPQFFPLIFVPKQQTQFVWPHTRKNSLSNNLKKRFWFLGQFNFSRFFYCNAPDIPGVIKTMSNSLYLLYQLPRLRSFVLCCINWFFFMF